MAMRVPLISRPCLLLLLAGCAATEDFSRPGTWQSTGANDANLRAMLADPFHAERGVSAEAERGQPASLAIRRLERGLRPALPAIRTSTFGGAEPAAAPAGDPDAR
jgi:hypothetical protein